MIRVGVVVFPGSNCDIDAVNALRVAGAEPVILWHESADLDGVAAIVLPGGFAYGDYLRAGVIARFSPVMRAVAAFAAEGGLVLGICNGFQVLAEAGSCPARSSATGRCGSCSREVAIAAGAARLAVHPGAARSADRSGCRSRMARAAISPTTRRSTTLERSGGVLFRYVQADGRPAGGEEDPANPNGSLRAIAGVTNAAGNVAGLMPHPETRRRARPRLGRRARDHPLARRSGRRTARREPDRRDGECAMSALAAAAAAEVPLHRRLGLTDEELVAIDERLGRAPNDARARDVQRDVERALLVQELEAAAADAADGRRGVVAGPGENAGVISIGDGLAVAFKIESHNHPSAVEPYQGAATGVGGILRDIFTMGARPIAVLDALRFGDPADPRTRHLVDGVVRGVGGYGNCVGVPTVGGELVFDRSYQGNPLVNVMAIGLLDETRLTLAAAPGPGNLAVLFGSTTGRDGIGGASVLASATFGADEPSKRPTVQVGDPFAEKLLIEASLELIERGLVEGLQDLGAGGITCATSETADRAGTGILVDLDAIPRREPGHGAVRGDDLRVPGADAGDRPAGSLGRRSARSASAGACRSRSSVA